MSFQVLDQPVEIVAPRLLGCYLERWHNGQVSIVKIVETEAYDETDAASHSFKSKSQRTAVMFGPSGRLYVYFTYGMHYCCNIVVGGDGYGAAVLIRAVEPIAGEDYLSFNRPVSGVNLTNGPAKLCQALNINKALNGHDLSKGDLRLIMKPELNKDQIVTTTRIGISKEKDLLRRFYIKGNPFVSR